MNVQYNILKITNKLQIEYNKIIQPNTGSCNAKPDHHLGNVNNQILQ